jgi:hypothetical protein
MFFKYRLGPTSEKTQLLKFLSKGVSIKFQSEFINVTRMKLIPFSSKGQEK